ncbi:MAG: hypothetical protein HONDAALG_02630 [Gammaproteobacteria bacterium]|nr:hypothetical protein [Gammaproteobacteria bacterium]
MRYSRCIKSLMVRAIFIASIATLVQVVMGQTNDKAQANKAEGPSVQITTVPPRYEPGDRMEPIAGAVSGVKFEEHKVVIFSRTDQWYVQPFIASPHTEIDSQGKWETDIHLGNEYAALLVKPSYKPPDKTWNLPKVGGDVLAIATARAKK